MGQNPKIIYFTKGMENLEGCFLVKPSLQYQSMFLKIDPSQTISCVPLQKRKFQWKVLISDS